MDDFYRDLEELEELSFVFCDKGRFHIPIVIYHELFRYSYPIEPYSNFKHDDPKIFLKKHIKNLLEFGKLALNLDLYDLSKFREDNYVKTNNSIAEDTTELYVSQWKKFTKNEIETEALSLIKKRIPIKYIEKYIVGKNVLDFGCGSGRYSLAMKAIGAKSVTALDYDIKSFLPTKDICAEKNINIEFIKGDIPNISLKSFPEFDFIFSNGVLHHTVNWKKSLNNYLSLIKDAGYLYLYANGGYFWNIRKSARKVFKKIPKEITQKSLDAIGLPNNRFIFMDTFYVPIEENLNKEEIMEIFNKFNFNYELLITNNDFDPLSEFAMSLPNYEDVWGEMEHRYLIFK